MSTTLASNIILCAPEPQTTPLNNKSIDTIPKFQNVNDEKKLVTITVSEIPTTPDVSEVTLDEAFPGISAPAVVAPSNSHEAFFGADALIKAGLERLLFSEAVYPTRQS